MRNRQAEAVAAAKRLGMDAWAVEAIRQAAAPLSFVGQTIARQNQIRAQHEAEKKAALKREWDSMTFAEFTARKAAGTLPPKNW